MVCEQGACVHQSFCNLNGVHDHNQVSFSHCLFILFLLELNYNFWFQRYYSFHLCLQLQSFQFCYLCVQFQNFQVYCLCITNFRTFNFVVYTWTHGALKLPSLLLIMHYSYKSFQFCYLCVQFQSFLGLLFMHYQLQRFQYSCFLGVTLEFSIDFVN